MEDKLKKCRKKPGRMVWLVVVAVIGVVVGILAGRRIIYHVLAPDTYMITTENHFDYQQHLECSGYASAYTIRGLGDDAEALELYDAIPDKNEDGTVPPSVLKKFLRSQGYRVRLGIGSMDQLKYDVSRGVPVVVLIRQYKNKDYLHYVPVVGYDDEYVYVADSLEKMTNVADEAYYNRRIRVADFKELWSTYLPNIYLRISK